MLFQPLIPNSVAESKPEIYFSADTILRLKIEFDLPEGVRRKIRVKKLPVGLLSDARGAK